MRERGRRALLATAAPLTVLSLAGCASFSDIVGLSGGRATDRYPLRIDNRDDEPHSMKLALTHRPAYDDGVEESTVLDRTVTVEAGRDVLLEGVVPVFDESHEYTLRVMMDDLQRTWTAVNGDASWSIGVTIERSGEIRFVHSVA